MDTPSSSRVIFDEEGVNGLILCDKYLPNEMLMEIFCYADYKTLLSCQLVCKRWKMLIENSKVWRKKKYKMVLATFLFDYNWCSDIIVGSYIHIIELTISRNAGEFVDWRKQGLAQEEDDQRNAGDTDNMDIWTDNHTMAIATSKKILQALGILQAQNTTLIQMSKYFDVSCFKTKTIVIDKTKKK